MIFVIFLVINCISCEDTDVEVPHLSGQQLNYSISHGNWVYDSYFKFHYFSLELFCNVINEINN